MAKTPSGAPAIDVAVVLLTPGEDDLMVYLRRRRQAPQADLLSLPTTRLAVGQTPDEAAHHVLDTLTGVRGVYLNQLYTFSDVGRHHDGHTITIAYYALFPTTHQRANTYPLEDAWVGLRQAVKARLAFDHARILDASLQRLQGRLDYTNDAYRMLPDRFTIPQLQHVHELVLGQSLKADVFTKRAVRNGLRRFRTKETAATGSGGRPARLYRNPALEAASR